MATVVIETPTKTYARVNVSEAELQKLEGEIQHDTFVVFEQGGVETRLNVKYIISVTVIER